jgi:hypothetical protein
LLQARLNVVTSETGCITHGVVQHPAGGGFGCLLTKTGSYLGNRGSLITTSFFVWNITKVSGALFAVEDLQNERCVQ